MKTLLFFAVNQHRVSQPGGELKDSDSLEAQTNVSSDHPTRSSASKSVVEKISSKQNLFDGVEAVFVSEQASCHFSVRWKTVVSKN